MTSYPANLKIQNRTMVITANTLKPKVLGKTNQDPIQDRLRLAQIATEKSRGMWLMTSMVTTIKSNAKYAHSLTIDNWKFQEFCSADTRFAKLAWQSYGKKETKTSWRFHAPTAETWLKWSRSVTCQRTSTSSKESLRCLRWIFSLPTRQPRDSVLSPNHS